MAGRRAPERNPRRHADQPSRIRRDAGERWRRAPVPVSADLPLDDTAVFHVIRAQRSRWRIENETCNTLKNRSCEIEHIFGRGERHLSSVFSFELCRLFRSIRSGSIAARCSKRLWPSASPKFCSGRCRETCSENSGCRTGHSTGASWRPPAGRPSSSTFWSRTPSTAAGEPRDRIFSNSVLQGGKTGRRNGRRKRDPSAVAPVAANPVRGGARGRFFCQMPLGGNCRNAAAQVDNADRNFSNAP